MTPEALQELKRLKAAATPGPYQRCGHDRQGCICGWVWSKQIDAPFCKVPLHWEDVYDLTPEQQAANTAWLEALLNAAEELIELAEGSIPADP